MATRSKITRSSSRRSGSGGIDQLTSVDHSVTLTPASGTGPIVDLSAAGGVSSVVAGDPGITVSTTAHVATVGQNIGAEWTLGDTRVYAIDSTRPDDSGKGFADPATSSAADYRTASVAAGAVAKKTVAGLSAIFPKQGGGRFVEIQINAVGSYSATDLAAMLNGVSGYASIVVRGTGTQATAGTTKFDGTAEDTSYVGGVPATGLNAPGYNPTSSFTSGQHLVLVKVGGGGPGFTVSGPPLGLRGRFDVATTTAALRNAARQVGRVNSTDNIFFQTQNASDAVNTDVLYLEQPGVVMTGDLAITAPGTDGIIFVGLDFTGLITDTAGRHRFVFCTSDNAGANTFSSPTGVVFAQDYTHPVYGATTVGGGLRATGSAAVSNGPLSMNGFVTVLGTNLSRVTGAPLWGAGCACHDLTIDETWAGATSDAANNPDIGVSDTTNIESQPYVFGANASAAMVADGSSLRIGRMRFENSNGGLPVLLVNGKCNLQFVGASNVTCDGTGFVGLSLKFSTGSEIGAFALPALTGTSGDILLSSSSPSVFDVWSHLSSQEVYDNARNHLFELTPTGGGTYVAAVNPSVFQSAFSSSFGNAAPYSVLKMSPGSAFTTLASAGNVTSAAELAGLAEQDTSGGGFSGQTFVRPFSGASLALFDALNPPIGASVYLSGTSGTVTVTPPTTGPVIFLGTVATNFPGTARALVSWNAYGAGNAVATWPANLIRVYAVDFVNGNDSNIGYATATATGAGPYATAVAAAGAVAKKTLAGLAAIFPRSGAGRIAEVVIANGGVNTVETYTDQLGIFLNGVIGYYQLNVRATGTNATAGCVAFDGSSADVIYEGGITVTGLNVAGYNPVGASTTSLPCQLNGGGAAALPAEPAAPLGWRVRFDANTTTAALRNQCRQIAAVTGGNTITPQTAFTAVPANADIFYIEQAGVQVAATTISLGFTVDQQFASGVVASTISGLDFSAGLTINSSGMCLSFAHTTSLTLSGANNINIGQFFVHPILGVITPGGGLRCDGSPFFNSISGQLLLNGVVATTTTTLLCTSLMQFRDGCYVNGHLSLLRSFGNGAGTDMTDFPPAIGALTAQAKPRVVGRLSVIGGATSLGVLDITGSGANPAIDIQGQTILGIGGAVTGSTGNNDVGFDLTLSHGSIIILGSTTPTVTGALGDVRLGDGTIITWAMAAQGLIDSHGNQFIGLPALRPNLFAGIGSDAFSLMAARAAAFAVSRTTPITFNSIYKEDFAQGILTGMINVGGVGAINFSTQSNNLGLSGGLVSVASGPLNADTAIIVPVNDNSWITDVINTNFYIEFYAKLVGPMTQTNSLHGMGLMRASAPTGNTPYALFGLLQNGAFGGGATVNLGFELYDGVTVTKSVTGVVADLTAFHYYALAHDAVTHLFYGYVDGVLAGTFSDAGFAAATAGTAFCIFDQGVNGGSILCDKVYSAVL